MNSTPSTKAKPANIADSEYDRYMLRNANEIRLILKRLRDQVAQITIFFREGQDMILTTLAEVADDHVIFDYGPDMEINRKALEAKRFFCVASLEKVPVQFLLRSLTKTMFEGRPSFHAELPEELLRLQRREHFRVMMPVVNRLNGQVTIPSENEGGEPYIHEAVIYDISGGGLNISAPPDEIPIKVGMRLTDCRVELPEIGEITCDLQVRNIIEDTLKNGVRFNRIGCAFVDIPGRMMNLVQRYILKLERERKAKASGLG